MRYLEAFLIHRIMKGFHKSMPFELVRNIYTAIVKHQVYSNDRPYITVSKTEFARVT